MTTAIEAHDEFVHPTIPIRYLVEMAESGEAVYEGLASVGIPLEALDNPSYRVSGAHAQVVYDLVARDTDDELCALFRRPVPRGTYAIYVRLAARARDLGGALATAVDLYGLFDTHAPWSITTRGGVATIALRPRTRRQRESLLYTHMMLLAPWRTACWLANESLELAELRLPSHLHEYAREAQYLFEIPPILARGPAVLRFGAGLLDLPVRRSAAEASAWARTSSLAAMLGRPQRSTLESRVRASLAGNSPLASASLLDTARALGISASTLARRLRQGGRTFRAVKDDLRRDLAITHLSDGQSVADVAELLGYSEASAFQRAFKTWTGVPPGRYRR